MSDIIASAIAMTSITENQHNTIGKPANAITPATLTAMVGLKNGGALQRSPNIQTAINNLRQVYVTNPSLGASANAAATNLETLSNKLMASGPAGLGQIMGQVRAHIAESAEIVQAQNFMANTKFGDYGSGISNMADLTTQGLPSLGDPSALAATFENMGPAFDTSDMANFGKPGGLVSKIQSLRLGNSTGLNAALIKQGIDIENLNDPSQAAKMDKVLGSITDKQTLTNIADRMGVLKGSNPFEGMKSYTGADASVNTSGQTLLGVK